MSELSLCAPGEVRFQSSNSAVRASILEILSQIKQLDVSEDVQGWTEIVLAEVLNNIAEHAYPDDDRTGPVSVNYRLDAGGLHFHIVDEGGEMPDGELPLAKAHDLLVDLDDLPEGGFGWFMIHNLAKDLNYKRLDGRNEVTFWIER